MQILRGQEKQVYDYLLAHPGATVREMRDGTFPGVQKPCMRMSYLKNKGIEIEDMGRNKHREKMYRLKNPAPAYKTVYVENPETGDMRPVRVPIISQ
jgi:hypothetical protein